MISVAESRCRPRSNKIMRIMPNSPALIFVIGALVSYALAQSQSAIPSDHDIRRILIQRIDEAKQSVGIVVGVIEPAGRRVISYGALAKNDKRALDGNTVFEIGS